MLKSDGENVFAKWAAKWGVHAAAVADLGAMYFEAAGVGNTSVSEARQSEAYVQSAARLEGARSGYNMMRNNVGALQDERGVPVRYGLMNESKEVNTQFKSSDLIGYRERKIVQADVGTVIAQFAAREIKHAGWVYKGTPRERAQMNFINLVNMAGGDAKFACGPGSYSVLR